MTDPQPAPTPNPLSTPTELERRLGALVAGFTFPRMGLWLWVSIALLASLWFVAAHMLKVILFKVVVITIGGFLGYHIHRGAEASGPRPHELLKQAESFRSDTGVMAERGVQLEGLAAHAYLRRVIVIAACVVAAALGS